MGLTKPGGTMPKNYCYIRVSTSRQDYQNQRYGLLEFANKKGLKVDEWIEETTSGTKKVSERNLGKLIEKMQKDDVLIVTELSRIGRSLFDIMATLNVLMEKGVKVYSVKENYELGDNINSKVLSFAFGLSAEIERSLISARTKEALAKRKASGKSLGRPKGYQLEKVKLSEYEDKIKELIRYKVSYRAIARMFDCSHTTVAHFVRTRCAD
jgi:DNA invertase Pin-like site-specific DNA recombinase